MDNTTVKSELIQQRLLLLQHFIKLNAWCGESKNIEGSEIARKALIDFDKTYGKYIIDEK